jgi:protein O-GlcNAc transferase
MSPSATMFDTDQILQHGLSLHQAGRLHEAQGVYQQILALDPNHADGLHLLGVIAHQGGRNQVAVDLIGKAIARNDRVANYHCNIGTALQMLGRFREAETHYQRAINLDPEHVEAHNNLGNTLMNQGKLAQAEKHFRAAISLRPAYAEGHYNLGNAVNGQGRIKEAVRHYREAATLKPGWAQAHYNLGHTLAKEGGLVEAAECYRRAISLDPGWADAHTNLGAVLHELDRLVEAEACYRRTLGIRPDDVTALDNLAAALRSMGRIEEAVDCLRRALAANPDAAVPHTNLIFALNFLPMATAADHQAERRRWDERHARRFVGSIRQHANVCNPQRRLRVGYISSHFRHQAATFAFGGVIVSHDPKQFEVICYSDTTEEDYITTRLRARADKWHHTAKLSDEELAHLIGADGIDILVDLVGHMSGHRLLVFARKPAPIQVTAWGEPTGTGLNTMDYLLADPILVPAAERELLAEKVVELPNFLGFWTPEPLPAVSPLPALSRGYFTFGSFNRLDKIQDPVVRTWAKILNALPNSRILLKNRRFGDPTQRGRIMDLFAVDGVAPERVEFLPAATRVDHFSAYHMVDIALDTFPHGGGMTTLDALWMGVPVVTSPGRTISSRLAAASLSAAGLTDFIAPDLDGYVDLAVAKASNLPALATLRAGLRERLEGCAFGDPERYARAVEARYREIWQRWCAERGV